MNLLVTLAVLAAFSLNVAFSRRRSKENLPPIPQRTFNELCQSGDGSSYRGTVSQSFYNKRCLNWNRFFNPWGASKGIGNHNYCRNPDKSLMPWCHVRRGRQIVKQFCDIPRCSPPTVKPPPPSPPAVDTELTCGERSERRLHKIVGGSFASIESHPWVTAIFHQRSFLCGGSLIAPCWVVTAAHCFVDGDEIDTEKLSVYLGKSAINDTDAEREQSFTVERVVLHEKYNVDSQYNNDIALLKIRGRDGGCAVKSASARSVCLPPAHTQLPSGYQCSIAGFGFESSGAWHYSQYLKQAKVKLISQSVCKRESYYGNLITQNMFCAGSPDWSTDACKGDSGGPLICEVSGRMFLFGVVSWGEGCALENKPGVYTQVTNYNQWIAAKTGLSKYTKGLMYPKK